MLIVLMACRKDDAPTGWSPPPPPSQGTTVEPPVAPSRNPDPMEQIFCDGARVRFSSPGYVKRGKVGLYVSFRDIPDGEKRLKLWWDYVENRHIFRNLRIEDDSVEDVFEYVYDGLTKPTEFVVRAEIIVDGQKHCARNRRVTVSPPPPPISGGGPIPDPGTQPATAETAFVGMSDRDEGTNSFHTNHGDGLRFTVLRTMMLQSVRVYTQGTGTMVIQITDTNDNPVGSVSNTISTAGDQRVSVGTTLQPGDYRDSADGVVALTCRSLLKLYRSSVSIRYRRCHEYHVRCFRWYEFL